MAEIFAAQRKSKLSKVKPVWNRPEEAYNNLNNFNGTLKTALEELFAQISVDPDTDKFDLWKSIYDYNNSAKIYNATLKDPKEYLATMIAYDGKDTQQYIIGFPQSIEEIGWMTVEQVNWVLLKLGVQQNFIVGGGALPDDYEPTPVKRPETVQQPKISDGQGAPFTPAQNNRREPASTNGAVNGVDATPAGPTTKEDANTTWLKAQLRVAIGLPAHSTLATVGFP